MKRLFAELLHDEQGVILSAETVLLGTVGVIGATVGLSAASHSVNDELTEVAMAFRSLDQSFEIEGAASCGARVPGSHFHQQPVERSLHQLRDEVERARDREHREAAEAREQLERQLHEERQHQAERRHLEEKRQHEERMMHERQQDEKRAIEKRKIARNGKAICRHPRRSRKRPHRRTRTRSESPRTRMLWSDSTGQANQTIRGAPHGGAPFFMGGPWGARARPGANGHRGGLLHWGSPNASPKEHRGQ